MLSKKGYLIHFARLFFASLLFGICSLFSHVWNKYQPFNLAFQLQRCQSTISIMNSPHINIWNWLENFHFIHLLPTFSFLTNSITQKCHLYIKDDYPININKFLYFILFIYFGYHLIQLLFFHYNLKQLEEKQHFYACLYRQDQKQKKRKYR